LVGVEKHRYVIPFQRWKVADLYFDQADTEEYLLGRSVLGDSLGALRDGMLGELTREDETHGGLHLARRQGRLLVVADQLASLTGDALEDVVDERVHDRHGGARDTSVLVNLLEHLVDVRRVRFRALLAASRHSGLSLSLCFSGHFD